MIVLTFPSSVGFPAIESLIKDYICGTAREVEWFYANVYGDDGETPLNWW